MGGPISQNPNDVTAILGLSIEPLAQIQVQLASSLVKVTPGTEPAKDPVWLAERIVKHLFNYISGFVNGAVGPESAVPMGLVAKWYEGFTRKIKTSGAGFLERDE